MGAQEDPAEKKAKKENILGENFAKSLLVAPTLYQGKYGIFIKRCSCELFGPKSWGKAVCDLLEE